MKNDLYSKSQNLNILLAEDDPDDQDLIKDAFSELGTSYVLHIVPDGKAALNYLENTPPDQLPCLIILDYNMPELNGAKVLEKICNDERYDAIPKVVLSTSNSPFYIDECMNKGANAYRVKPSNFYELVNIAKEMLELCQDAA